MAPWWRISCAYPRHPNDYYTQTLQCDGLPIRAHDVVEEAALHAACHRVKLLLAHLPQARDNLITLGGELHIIGRQQVTSDLPEHRHMRGVVGSYSNDCETTIDERTRGVGGLLTSCGEENLLGRDSDPRYPGRDICVHEFAHTVMDFGLGEEQRREIEACYQESAVNNGVWNRKEGLPAAYAATNPSEYWAELSMWYFGTHGEYTDRERKLPPAGREGLRGHDPQGFALLDKIYSGNVNVPRLPPLKLLKSQGTAVPSTDCDVGGGVRTIIVFSWPGGVTGEGAASKSVHDTHDPNNAGPSPPETELLEICWATQDTEAEGHRRLRLYSTLPLGGRHAQVTYAGQTWVVRRQHTHEVVAVFAADEVPGSAVVSL